MQCFQLEVLVLSLGCCIQLAQSCCLRSLWKCFTIYLRHQGQMICLAWWSLIILAFLMLAVYRLYFGCHLAGFARPGHLILCHSLVTLEVYQGTHLGAEDSAGFHLARFCQLWTHKVWTTVAWNTWQATLQIKDSCTFWARSMILKHLATAGRWARWYKDCLHYIGLIFHSFLIGLVASCCM